MEIKKYLLSNTMPLWQSILLTIVANLVVSVVFLCLFGDK